MMKNVIITFCFLSILFTSCSHAPRYKRSVGFSLRLFAQVLTCACMSARNYINRFDIVPFADPFGLIRGIRGGNVHYLPSSGSPIRDHLYESDNFKQLRRTHGTLFKTNYGMAA